MLKDEELKGKYIKYSPEITEEIFNRIIKKLDKSFKKADREPIVKNNFKFETFVSNYRYLWINLYGKEVCFSLDNHCNNCTEISYKDIIGEEEWWKSLKKGDYIVAIKNSQGGYLINHIYEIKHYSSSGLIDTMLDSVGSTTNGWGYMNFRPATPEEITMYEHAGKPVNVTTYKIPEMVIGNYYRVEEEDFYMIGICESVGDSRYSKATYISLNNELPYGDGFRKSAIWYYSDIDRTFKEATPEEKQWLNVCIAENKFVEKDYALRGYDMYGNALKSEVTSEEIVKATSSVELVVGNWYELHVNDERWIFKFLEFKKPNEVWNTGLSATPDDNCVNRSKVSGYLTGKLENCKPADMEEVYRLFPEERPKEEFVLPEKWCIKVTNNNRDVLTKWVISKPDFDNCSNYTPIRKWITSNSGYDKSYQKWTEDIPKSYEEITFEQFKKYVLKEEPKEITSYDGLKVGDVLPEKVICAWADKDYNWICLFNFKPTWKKSGGFIGDRYIESFKDIDGYISFLVSDTTEVYLKASGFKAFMEGYSIKTGKGILDAVEPKKSSEFPLITSSKVKIGDRIRIISSGNRYTSFDRAFKAIGFKNTVENIAGYNGDKGTVFYITKHPGERDKTLIAINLDNGKQCLINETGIEVINDSKKTAVFDPEEWGWVIPTSVHLKDLRDYTNPLTPDKCIKQDVISPILFNVKEI